MRKGEIIQGYKIIKDFEVAGGQSKISFAKKGGETYFIKEFLAPRFPVKGSPGSAKTLEKRRKKCSEFERHHRQINRLISERCGLGGNLVYAVDFFRNGTSYYKVNEKIDVSTLTPKEISKLHFDKKILIAKTICHSLNILHSLNIVHGDIKPDNVLIKETKTGNFTTKLIDFDNCYFSGLPPTNKDEMVGDQVYYSPELAKYLLELGEIKAGDLTTKSDVFALGILYSEYFTGNRPHVSSKFKYTWEALLNDKSPNIKIPKHTPDFVEYLIRQMLEPDPVKRPSLKNVFDILKGSHKVIPPSITDVPKDSSKVTPSIEPTGSKLKGSLVKKLETEPTKTEVSKGVSKPTGSKLKGSLIKKK